MRKVGCNGEGVEKWAAHDLDEGELHGKRPVCPELPDNLKYKELTKG